MLFLSSLLDTLVAPSGAGLVNSAGLETAASAPCNISAPTQSCCVSSDTAESGCSCR